MNELFANYLKISPFKEFRETSHLYDNLYVGRFLRSRHHNFNILTVTKNNKKLYMLYDGKIKLKLSSCYVFSIEKYLENSYPKIKEVIYNVTDKEWYI